MFDNAYDTTQSVVVYRTYSSGNGTQCVTLPVYISNVPLQNFEAELPLRAPKLPPPVPQAIHFDARPFSRHRSFSDAPRRPGYRGVRRRA